MNELCRQAAEKLKQVVDSRGEGGPTPREFSAVAACIFDCHGSFEVIYEKLILKLAKIDSDRIDDIHSLIVDTFWEFDHIEQHVRDAKKGFIKIMNLLEEGK